MIDYNEKFVTSNLDVIRLILIFCTKIWLIIEGLGFEVKHNNSYPDTKNKWAEQIKLNINSSRTANIYHIQLIRYQLTFRH